MSHDYHLVGLLVQYLTTIKHIAMKFGTKIGGPWRIDPTDFGVPQTF